MIWGTLMCNISIVEIMYSGISLMKEEPVKDNAAVCRSIVILFVLNSHFSLNVE